MERRPGWARRWVGLALLAAVGLACAVLSQLRLDPASIPALEAAMSGWFGDAQLERVGAMRFDPILARGVVVSDVRVRWLDLELEIPTTIVRPRLSALLRGRLEPTVIAHRFTLRLASPDPLTAVRRLETLLAESEWPDVPLWFRRGEVRTPSGGPLLDRVEIRLVHAGGRPELQLRARSRGGGRLDGRARPAGGSGKGYLDVYVDGVGTGDLREILAHASGRPRSLFAAAPLETLATGHWYASVDQAQVGLHQIDLRFEVFPDGSPRERLTARVTGSLRRVAGAVQSASRSRLPIEGWLRLDARFGRLHTVSLAREGEGARLLISGPASARLWLDAGGSRPRARMSIDLEDTLLAAGEWLRKPTGVAASLGAELDPLDGTTRFEVALAGLRADGEWRRDGSLDARSEWWPVDRMAAVSPPLSAWATSGVVRLAWSRPGAQAPGAGGGEEWRLDFDAVDTEHRALPAPLRGLSGSARLVDRRLLEAAGVEMRVGSTPVALDLRAERGEDQRLHVRFHARADAVTLPASESAPQVASTQPSDGSAGEVPMLRAMLEEPIVILRRERVRLDSLALEAGIFEAQRIESANGTLQDLVLEIGLDDRRLDVRRLRFHDGRRTHRYRGWIDLNPLVPDVRLAAASVPTPPPASPAP